MAKFLLIGALVFMLATGAIAFLAKGNVDKLQSTLTETKGTLATTTGKLKATKTELDKTTEDLKVANTTIEEKNKEIATLKGQMDDLNKKIAEAATMIETKTGEVAALTAELQKLKDSLPTGVPGEDLSVKIAELNTALQKAQTELGEAQQVQKTLTGRLADTETKLSAAEFKEKQRLAGYVRPGLQGRILAVNAGWNFVVLSIGDKQGAVINAPLLVVRGNEPIAKVRITSVETSTSIADVVPGSVRKGVTVQPGDNVVFEGRSGATQAPEPAVPSSQLPRP